MFVANSNTPMRNIVNEKHQSHGVWKRQKWEGKKKNSTKHTEGTIIVTRSRFYIRSRWQELTIRWV